MTKNIILLIVLVTVLYILWINGLETVYAYLLKTGVNVLFGASKFYVELDNSSGHPALQMHIDERNYIFEPLQTIIFPFVLLLAWQIFVFFHKKRKVAFKLAGKYIGIFYGIQTLYLCLLYGIFHDKLEMAQKGASNQDAIFIFGLLKNNFPIIVLFMILIQAFFSRISLRKPLKLSLKRN